jgi:hypothetical protein
MIPKKIPKGHTGYDSKNKFHVDPSLINPNAVYEPPIKTKIGNIPTIIVDPHNEVLPFWYKKGKPRTLFHIDAHSDTCADVKSLEQLKREGLDLSIQEYVKTHLDMASFIAPAIFYRLIDKLYWFNPREDFILELASDAREENGKIRFGYVNYLPKVYETSFENAIQVIKRSTNFILDIDLDAFECIEDQDYWNRRKLSFGSTKLQRFLGKSRREKRFSKVKTLLQQLPSPEIITIATSQTPISTTPPENAGFLEGLTLDMLVELYQKAA